jgi:hypothetical protein
VPLLQLNVTAGRHVIAVTAVDVAGNADGSAAVVDVIVDVTAPRPPRFTLLHERGCFVLPLSSVYVCNSSAAVAFDAGCNETSSSDTAPCLVQWRVDTVSVSGGGSACAGVVDGGNDTAGGSWTLAGDGGSPVQPPLSRDGQYRVWWRAVDGAGNEGGAYSMVVWLDTTPPSKEPTFVAKPDAVSFLTSVRLEVKTSGDTSPGRLSFVYELTRGAVVEPLATAPLPEPTNDDAVQVVVGGLQGDQSYSIRVWTQASQRQGCRVRVVRGV